MQIYLLSQSSLPAWPAQLQVGQPAHRETKLQDPRAEAAPSWATRSLGRSQRR